MVKLLFFLTILFFTISTMFFVFLTKFNEESKRAALISKVAGVATSRIDEQERLVSTKEPTFTPTPEPTDEPTPTAIPKKIVEIKLGEIKIGEEIIDVKGVEIVEGDEGKVVKDGKIPWQDFDLKLNFPENVNPGSSDNKIIFQNKEYEIKILNKKGEALNSFLFKIDGTQVIIDPEMKIWEGNTNFEVGIYVDGNKTGGVKFDVE